MEKKSSKLAVLTKAEISKTATVLNVAQINLLLSKTPESQIKKRKAKGGGTWDYVTGAYFKKMLNLMFGFDWSFTILDKEYDLKIGQTWIQGRLTVNVWDEKLGAYKSIVKEQFGRQDIKFKNDYSSGKAVKTDIPLDLGNDLKAAATDALKKCASELGIASDIYAADEYKEIFVIDDSDDLNGLMIIEEFIASDDFEAIGEENQMYLERISEEKEVSSYTKAIKFITKFQKDKFSKK